MTKKATPALIEDAVANPRWHTQRAQIVPPPLPSDRRTAEDTIRHACAPPVVESKARLDTRDALGRLHDQLQNAPGRPGARGKRDSASWMSSLVLHAVFVAFLALLLAPADLGGTATQLLLFSFSDENEVEQEPVVQVAIVASSEPVPVETPPLPADPPPPAVSPDGAIAAADRGESASVANSGAAGGKQAAPRGSFFGIEANGHDFVYVLDMSGSMRGRRFRRATAELVRSVSGLQETQKFYVLLFNGSAVQMYGESNLHPTPVPATIQNKRKLSHWLNTAYRGGSTDPRGALRVALRMKPSAIFMLSDGEFDEQKGQSRSRFLGGDSDTFSIVAAAASKTPIHAIAFEDPQSCDNMKRLAQMTNGEYRFSESQSESSARDSLGLARAAFERGDKATAEILMREIVATHGQTEAGWKAREDLAAMLSQFAENAIKDGKLDIAKEALMSIVEMDPQAVVTAQSQQELVTEFLRRSKQPSDRNEQKTVMSMLAEIVERFPKSSTTQRILAPVADGLLLEARASIAGDNPVQAMKKLDLVLKKYPETAAAIECEIEQQRIIDDLLAEARKLRRTKGDVAYAKRLRALTDTFAKTQVDTVATEALEALAIEMLAKARDANYERDLATRNDTNRQLREGFAGDRVLTRMRQDLSRQELQARELLREGNRLEKFGLDEALRQYKDIIKNYSGTLAARKAKGRLQVLEGAGVARDDETAELLEMMQ